ncbi:hypothetical protein WN943_010740 [Citrus x changshan-huyou]
MANEGQRSQKIEAGSTYGAACGSVPGYDVNCGLQAAASCIHKLACIVQPCFSQCESQRKCTALR